MRVEWLQIILKQKFADEILCAQVRTFIIMVQYHVADVIHQSRRFVATYKLPTVSSSCQFIGIETLIQQKKTADIVISTSSQYQDGTNNGTEITQKEAQNKTL